MKKPIGPANTESLLTINSDDIRSDLQALREAFQALDVGLRKKYMGAAVRKAGQPAFRAFKGLIPKGPTGNLSRSAAMVVRKYDYVSLALIGYQMAHGDDENAKGWGQGFMEYGTAERFTRSEYATSYNKRGPFKTYYMGDGEYEHDPPYPWSFFARAKRGESMMLGRSPKGGIAGKPPLAIAWASTGAQCQQILLTEMVSAFDKAAAEQLRRIKRGAK